MQQQLVNVDCIIEVHDARVSFPVLFYVNRDILFPFSIYSFPYIILIPFKPLEKYYLSFLCFAKKVILTQSNQCALVEHALTSLQIPLSGRNELFRSKLLGVRPHLLILNKCDLIPKDTQPLIVESMKKNGYAIDILFTDCRTAQGENATQVCDSNIFVFSTS